MNKATMSHQRESQVSKSVPQSYQLAHGEPDQDEVLEEGIFPWSRGRVQIAKQNGHVSGSRLCLQCSSELGD